MSYGQGGPGGFTPPTPDWENLAAASEAARRRKRRWLLIGGGALATAAIGGIVATAVVTAGGGDKPSDNASASDLPAEQSLDPKPPEPSFSDVSPPPPPDPREFIASAKKDKAPLSASTLFPGKSLTIDGRKYAKATTSSTKSCASATQGALGTVLQNNNCKQVYRATYVRGGVAVTLGIAVFETSGPAEKAKEQSKGNIASLSGGGVPTFCRATACRLTANAVGRYAYFTVAGYTSGKAVTSSDTQARQAGRDAGDFAFNTILDRGKKQAEGS